MFRHYEKIKWATIPIIIAAFSILALTWEVSDRNILVFLGAASIILSIAFFHANRRLTQKIRWISDRIDWLEDIQGMDLHRQIRRRERERVLNWLETVRSEGFYIVHIASFLLVVLWIVRIALAFGLWEI